MINTSFIQERFGTQHGEMLDSIDAPFQLAHADLADLNCFNKFTVAPKYCVLCVDLFASKTYAYGIKQKTKLRNILEAFYEEIDNERSYLKKENRYSMRPQTNQEFNQNEIKILYNKFNVEQLNSKLNEGHTVGVEQKN